MTTNARSCARRTAGVPRTCALVLAWLLPLAGVAQAQNSMTAGGAQAADGQAEVVVPISATTTIQLTGLDAAIEFDPELCKRIENQQIRKAGRTLETPQEGARCPDAGQLSLVLFNLSGDPVLPTGEGLIAEWVFSVRTDAASGTFPLTLVVNQARNGPLRVNLSAGAAGEVVIQGVGTVTPTTVPDTATPTPELPTATSTAPPSTLTPTAAATDTAIEASTATVTPIATASQPPVGTCVGDCGDVGAVTVANLIVGVNIVLGNREPSACAAFQNAQGVVDISQLIRGVNNLLNGCPA